MPSGPEPTDPTEPAPWEAFALAAGVLAALLWFPLVDASSGTLVVTLLSVGLAAGTMGAAARLLRWGGLAITDGLIAGAAGYLGWPVLARRLSRVTAIEVPAALSMGLLLEVASVLVGLFLVATLGRWRPDPTSGAGPVATMGIVGWGGSLAALAAFASTTGEPSQGVAVVLGLTGATVAAALAAQRLVAVRVGGPRLAAFGTAPALVVAGAQLLDGMVSYLAVVDPLEVLAGRFQEQVAVSATLLDTTGLGYPLAKWGIALAFVTFLDGDRTLSRSGIARLGAYLVVALLGLGPGLFSTTQVIAG